MYNHGWMIGDESAISVAVQAEVDRLLECNGAPSAQSAQSGQGVSQAEHPDRLAAEHEVTVEDVRQLMGASTPHFALQLRERIRTPHPGPARRAIRHASRASVRSLGWTGSRSPARSAATAEAEPAASARRCRASAGPRREPSYRA